MTAAVKTCSKCKVEKSIDEFYRSTVCSSRPDGVYPSCKVCHKAAVQASQRKRLRRVVTTINLNALGVRWCCGTGNALSAIRSINPKPLEETNGN